MTRRPNHSRGFAMLMALAMLGMLAIALIVLAQYFAYQTARTRSVTDDAQLSQLLLAGAQDVATRARSWDVTPPTQSWKMELPKPLSTQAGNVAIDVRPAGDNGAVVMIDASLDARRAAQTLQLRHLDAGWEITSVELAGAQ